TVILAAIALSLMAVLMGCNTPFNLDEYKTTAKAEIENCVIVSDYSAENWAVVLELIEDGKAAITAATNKAGVDSSVTEAKTQIDAVEKEKKMGASYSLQEAFDKGLLTKEDLQNIAYYHNDDSMPVFPESLDAGIAEAIKRDFVHHENCQDKAHEIEIKYYGTYDDSVAVLIYCQLSYAGVLYNETVDDVFFYYGSPDKILIWKEKAEIISNTIVLTVQ
ncbi:MAG: hypothetical protein FWE85_05350, partial [Clostridiales bacterium]|nr:hypothetical protein [Clostridiales bacterium]